MKAIAHTSCSVVIPRVAWFDLLPTSDTDKQHKPPARMDGSGVKVGRTPHAPPNPP